MKRLALIICFVGLIDQYSIAENNIGQSNEFPGWETPTQMNLTGTSGNAEGWPCGTDWWKCRVTGTCIPITSRCNNFDEDCGEDEENFTGYDISDEENCECKVTWEDDQNKPSRDCPSEKPICEYGICKENSTSKYDPCTPDYCMNGGTCVVRADAPNNAACDCQSAFTGERCKDTCQSCYGAESSTKRCCQTCNEVVRAFKQKGRNYNTSEFRQCDDSGINENNDDQYEVVFGKCCEYVDDESEGADNLTSAETQCTKDPKCRGVMRFDGPEYYDLQLTDYFFFCYEPFDEYDPEYNSCSNGIYFDKKHKSEFVNSRAKAKSKLGYPTEHKNMILGSGNGAEALGAGYGSGDADGIGEVYRTKAHNEEYGISGGYGPGLEGGIDGIEGGYTFRVGKYAHGMRRRQGMGFGSGSNARSGQTFNKEHLWSPNVESILKYTLPNLANEMRKTIKTSSTIADHLLKLDADVRVQAFADHTLRVKLDHILFFSNGSQISLGKAHLMLEDERSNQVGDGHTAQSFMNSLTTPFLIHTKNRLIKNVVISKNEPSKVKEIKKLLASDLGKNGHEANLELVMKKAIATPMETPRFPMKVDLGNPQRLRYNSSTAVGCGPKEWQCKKSGICISIDYLCDDNYDDCDEDQYEDRDESDEENCDCTVGNDDNDWNCDDGLICSYGFCKASAAKYDPCPPGYCKNGGTCRVNANLPNNAICDCPPSLAGDRCEDECKSCYGAESSTIRCCQTCGEVMQAFKEKGWGYNVTGTEQCDLWFGKQNDEQYQVMFQQRCTNPYVYDMYYSFEEAEKDCTEDPDCIGMEVWGSLSWFEDPNALYLCSKGYTTSYNGHRDPDYEYYPNGIVFNKKGYIPVDLKRTLLVAPVVADSNGLKSSGNQMSRLGSISDVKECLITTKRISTFDRVNTQLKLDSCWNMVYMNDDNFAIEVKKDDRDQIMVELTLPFSKIRAVYISRSDAGQPKVEFKLEDGQKMSFPVPEGKPKLINGEIKYGYLAKRYSVKNHSWSTIVKNDRLTIIVEKHLLSIKGESKSIYPAQGSCTSMRMVPYQSSRLKRC